MTYLVTKEEVMTLARTMRLPRKRDALVLYQQVEWRLTKRVMVLKWMRFPVDVIRLFLSFVGNESERMCRKAENKEKYTRINALVCFRVESDRWITLTQQEAHPILRRACRTRLIEMSKNFKTHPKFPWE